MGIFKKCHGNELAKKSCKDKKGNDIFSQKPHKSKLKRLKWMLAIMFLLLAFFVFVAICYLFEEKLKECECHCLISFLDRVKIIMKIPAAATGGAVLAAVVTFLFNEISKEKITLWNGESTINLYKSEIKDLIRHLNANAEILIQIRHDLTSVCKKVENIHFTNLKWPESSIIFSDEMAKLIIHEQVNDYTRVKINIRNLNNYSEWLQDISAKGEDLRPAIEWVITRHFGYIINLYYMEANGYRIPTTEQLKDYIDNGCVICEDGEIKVKDKLYSMFKDYTDDERHVAVNRILSKYWDDKSKKRCVFVS